MSKQKIVLDANVLYGSFLRDLLVSLFFSGIYEAKWTEKITQEWVGHLLENRSDIPAAKIDRTVMLMNRIKPAALIANYERYIPQIVIPDKIDPIVCRPKKKTKPGGCPWIYYKSVLAAPSDCPNFTVP
jgi:hypothetical protein